MTSWLPDKASLRRPVYWSLADAMAKAIDGGELAPGERLPTHRALAADLALSVQTVSKAYDELGRRGLIAGEVGRGTFVRAARRDPDPPFILERREGELIDLSMLKPVAQARHIECLQAALGRLQSELPQRLLFAFRPNVALRPHKDAAVAWLKRCGLDCAPDDVQITNGATPAMATALMTALRPGDVMVTEEIGHHTLVTLANYMGLRLYGLPMDEEGLLPEAFDEACREHKVKLLFVMPTAGSPTVGVMSAERRAALVEIARRHNVMVLENEAWGPLYADSPPPFAALAPERTFYVTSFTKCILPALRVGYLVAPHHLQAAAANRHLVTSWMAGALISEVAARWVADGTAEELLELQRRALRARNALTGELLPAEGLRRRPEGLNVWLPLPAAWDEESFVSHARLQGVAVAPGASFAIGPKTRTSAVRICIGGVSEDELRQGLTVIARLAQSQPEPALLSI